ncbi:TRAP transporter small permease [Chloroflexota bacterium]
MTRILHGIVRLAGRMFSRLSKSLYIFACYIPLAMAFIITYDVILRYGFNNPTEWTTDISEYMMVSLPLLTAAYLLQQEGHVSLGIIVDRLNPRNRMMLGFVTSIVGLLACIAVTWQSAEFTWDLFRDGIRVMRPLALPKWTVWVVLPVGSGLVSMAFIGRIFRFWTGWRSVSTGQKPELTEGIHDNREQG